MGLAKFFGINGLKKLLSEYELNMTSKEKEFVKNKKIGCKKITNTVYSELNKHKYTGTYFEHPNRNHELDIYFKEAFLATVFASLGFSIYMVEENELESGTKIDAIMNNVPVDFKIIESGKNAVKNNYQNGMDKSNCLGIIMHSKTFPNYDKTKAKDFDFYVKGITKIRKNGILCIWNEKANEIFCYDMKKIRASNIGGSNGRAPEEKTSNSL